VLSDGATPGKKALRLLVVHEDGTPVGWEASTLRNLVRAADLVPMFYVSGLVTVLFTDSFQRLGDLAAGTLVIYRDEKRRQRDVPEVPPHRAPVPLRLTEQRSVISFGQRGPKLPPARAEELAGIAEPLMHMDPAPISDPVRYLYQIAAYLVGRRTAEEP
jgi:hypothetical protein